MKIRLVLMIWVSAMVAHAEETPSIERILKEVHAKVSPDTSELPEGVETNAALLLEDLNAEMLLNRELANSNDRQIQVLHAITCLNNPIRYIEYGDLGEESDSSAQKHLAELKKLRRHLVAEYVRLSKLKQPNKAEK